MKKAATILTFLSLVALAPAAEARTKTVVDPQNNSTIQVQQGDNLALKLKATAGTGYQWKVVSTDRSLGYPTVKVEDLSPGRVGGALLYVLTWKTRVPYPILGAHRVKVAYLRSWEPNRPAKTLNLTIRVVQ
jgi:predicted secreted protein